MTAQPVQLDSEIEPDDHIDDADAFENDDDLAFAPSSRQGLGRLTTSLLIAIGLVAAFGAGIYAQKQQAPAAGAGFPGGGRAAFAAGGFPGGAPGGTTGATTNGTGSSTATATAAPAVIGTVVKVSGNKVTVKNFAGKTITVTVPSGTTVTKSSTLVVSDLKPGVSVTVTGTTNSDGNVAATAVTAR